MSALPRSRLLIAAAALLAWMLAAHPYWGIWHDGTLYFGQALLNSRVPQLAQDLFFASGSQDGYSIYSAVVAPLYRLLGQAATHITAVLCSWALMAGGVLALLRPLQASGLSNAWGLWGLLAFAVVTPIYGGGWVFGYAEPFLTARTFAEPLLLAALVALARGRTGVTAGLLVAAAALHPLMSLPVVVIAWCFAVQADRRWLWALAALPVALAAAVAGWAPWSGLLRRYDPDWWSMINTATPQVLPTRWTALEAGTVLVDVTVLATVARLRPPDALGRLLRAAVLAAVLLFAAALVLADGLRLVLPTQLQLWRVHWIAHLLAVVLSPWLVARLWQLGGLWPVSACALVLALINIHCLSPHGVAALLLWAGVSAVALRVRDVSALVRWLACGGIGLAIVATSATRLGTLLQLQAWQIPEAGWAGLFLLAASFPAIAMPAFAGLLALQAQGRAGRAAAGLLSAAFLLAVALHWDQRSDLARATETPPGAAHPFQAYIPPDASVYWPGELAPVWGLLERRHDFSPQQGAGMLFHRDNALAFGARRETYRAISEDHARCRAGALMAQDGQVLRDCDMPALHRLADLCAAPQPPGYLVLARPLRLSPLATWQPPPHREPPQTFALYDCRQITTPP